MSVDVFSATNSNLSSLLLLLLLLLVTADSICQPEFILFIEIHSQNIKLRAEK
jgi:hypothetical protein